MAKDSSQPTSLLKVFEDLDESTKQSLADIKSPLILGLATLLISDEQAQRPYLSAEHIIAALEASGVAIKRTQITNAFSKAGDRISRKLTDGEIHYRIMTSGRRQVEPFLHSGAISVLYVHGGKPRTARKILSDLLNPLSGEVRVCDPYYGIRTLDALEMLPISCTVRFLTAQTTENPIRLSGAISDFKRENPQIELRKFPDSKTLHDRYALSQDTLLILGHGIKDIGNKESFVVCVSSEYAKDLIESLIMTFDDRWKIATIL
jgi:hypothetical protein